MSIWQLDNNFLFILWYFIFRIIIFFFFLFDISNLTFLFYVNCFILKLIYFIIIYKKKCFFFINYTRRIYLKEQNIRTNFLISFITFLYFSYFISTSVENIISFFVKLSKWEKFVPFFHRKLNKIFLLKRRLINEAITMLILQIWTIFIDV